MGRPGSYKYLALLVALLLLIAVYPVFRRMDGSRIFSHVTVSAVYLTAGWVILTDRRLRILGLILVVPTLFGTWAGYEVAGLPEGAAIVAFHLFAATFQVFVLVVVLRGIARQETVTTDAIAGALCGYLLLGIAFGNVYCVADAVKPGMFAAVAGTTPDERHFLLTYYSFVTLTTVGYGDITPTGDAARSVSIAEAVLGQFYLAVLIAGLIGKRLAQPPPTESKSALPS